MFGDHHDNDSFRRQLLNVRTSTAIPEQTTTVTSSWLDGSKLGRGVSTLSLPTDFSTYNIAIHTRLDITIEVSCADKKFKMTKESGLVVLPPKYVDSSGPINDVGAPPGSPMAAAGPSEPAAPPPYENAPDYDKGGKSSTAENQKVAIEKMNGQ
jgi:hypothetical protein